MEKLAANMSPLLCQRRRCLGASLGNAGRPPQAPRGIRYRMSRVRTMLRRWYTPPPQCRAIAFELGCEAMPLAPPLPACGERSDSERSEGIRVRGRSRGAELVDKPPHLICFAFAMAPLANPPLPARGERWSKRHARCHLQAASHMRLPSPTRGEGQGGGF